LLPAAKKTVAKYKRTHTKNQDRDQRESARDVLCTQYFSRDWGKKSYLAAQPLDFVREHRFVSLIFANLCYHFRVAVLVVDVDGQLLSNSRSVDGKREFTLHGVHRQDKCYCEKIQSTRTPTDTQCVADNETTRSINAPFSPATPPPEIAMAFFPRYYQTVGA